MNERFKKVEDDYYRLKGQLQAGRITREQFEAALKDLMIQDAQGRWWIIGVNDAKWYVNDGQQWVEQQPPEVTASPTIGRALPPDQSSLAGTNVSRETERAQPRTPGCGMLVLLTIGLSSCLVNAGWLFFTLRQGAPGAFQIIIVIMFLFISLGAFFLAWIAYRRGK